CHLTHPVPRASLRRVYESPRVCSRGSSASQRRLNPLIFHRQWPSSYLPSAFFAAWATSLGVGITPPACPIKETGFTPFTPILTSSTIWPVLISTVTTAFTLSCDDASWRAS